MSEGISLEEFEAHLVASETQLDAQSADDGAFRVALLGDWSGRSNRGLFASGKELTLWRPRLVDRDNVDELMAQLGVALRLSLSKNSDLILNFDKLDDFHPDKVFERGEPFETLRDIRTRLSNTMTFPQAAAEVRKNLDVPERTKVSQVEPEETAAAENSSGSLLDQILATADSEPVRKSEPKGALSSDLQSFVRELVSPYLLPDDEEQDVLISAVDKAIGDLMRTVMHHPDFKALESAWRALDFLVSRLETGTELKLYLLDISRDELKAALMEADEVESGGVYKLIVEGSIKTFGGDRWSVLAGNYFFGSTAEDAELLKCLSRVAADSKAPFIAGALSSMVGCDSLAATPDPMDWGELLDAESETTWNELRRTATVEHLGLVLPRFLLRMPYGADTEPTEDFIFEEALGSEQNHETYLWGNPVFAVVCLLGQSFLQSGWQMRASDVQEIEGLPIHVFKDNGESQIKACAEILMTVRAAARIIELGLMPLITLKGTGAVRLGIVQSIASPHAALAGRWTT